MTNVPTKETELCLPLDSCLSTVREGRYLCRDYRVEDMLGKGGFGTVYSGRRKKDNTPVSFSSFYKLSVFNVSSVLQNNICVENRKVINMLTLINI